MLARWTTGHDARWRQTCRCPTGWPGNPTCGDSSTPRIGVPSPAERHKERLAEIRAGDCPKDVPERVSLFGLSTIPGGGPFLETLEALGTQTRCPPPSPPALASRNPCRRRRRLDSPASGSASRRRQIGRTRLSIRLLLSWGRPARESLVLLADHRTEFTADGPNAAPEPTSLLERVQHDLCTDTAPVGDFLPAPGDRSIQIHTCHGSTRQVEVLRDQILHLLADDPTLTEDDIVVLCPALDEFAPIIESVLGSPTGPEGYADGAAMPSAPTLSYRLTDRSLRTTSPLLGALGALVELLDSRFSDAAVLDFVNLSPVRERFGLEDDDLTTLADWVETANTRWGLDGAHRARWGIAALLRGRDMAVGNRPTAPRHRRLRRSRQPRRRPDAPDRRRGLQHGCRWPTG